MTGVYAVLNKKSSGCTLLWAGLYTGLAYISSGGYGRIAYAADSDLGLDIRFEQKTNTKTDFYGTYASTTVSKSDSVFVAGIRTGYMYTTASIFSSGHYVMLGGAKIGLRMTVEFK